MSTLSAFYGFDKDKVGNGKRKRVDPSALGSFHPSVVHRHRQQPRIRDKVTRMINVRVLRNHELVDDDVWMCNGKIINPESRFWDSQASSSFDPDEVIDGRGLIVAPGFIDIQINGAFGVDFTSTDITQEKVQEVARQFLQWGVTSFCPTIVSSSPETYRQIVPKIRPTESTPENGAGILGLHLEGPFMALQKKGAHDPATLHAPAKGFQSVLDCYGSNIDAVSIITLAPELKGAVEAISGCVEKGIVVSAGHCMADMEQATKAIDAGATLITHLFNAMPAFHHRDPGLIGLLGTTDRQPFYGIICDGIHCHPSSIKIAYLAHKDGLILVTDAMMAMGLSDGMHKLGQMDVRIEGLSATIEGTDTLAGVVMSLDRCVRCFRKFTGCSKVEALEAASLHPAQVSSLSVAVL